MARFVLTIRNGPQVERHRYDDLAGAVEALRAEVASVQGEGALPEVRMLRTFNPEDRVKARLEISTGRVLHRREAGIDVMGDGSIVPFRGGVFRRVLEPVSGQDAVDAVDAALRE